MKKLEYTVEFITPAFLGNAEQSAQWRTPPFKTMLRQWWRVLNANLSVSELCKKEGEVFGAALNDSSLQSRVRIRLGNWAGGKMKDWPLDPTTPHKEVNGGMAIGSHLYLGYGPLTSAKGTKLKNHAAIQCGEKTTLTLIADSNNIPYLDTQLADAMQLVHWFGTLGGRSRNGWGSANFLSKGDALISFDQSMQSTLLKKILLPLSDCLNFDYPSALGTDSAGALVWKAKKPADSWQEAMKELAKIKISLRTHFSFSGHADKNPMYERHVLSYPVTKHSTRDYDTSARLPNQLRFKVHKTNEGKFLPVAFHFPIKIPNNVFSNGHEKMNKSEQLAVWQKAHTKMDELMERVK